ncbi:hypothetical protein KGF56_003488 [Candida oxycetoniae]|uniref:Uncharacterized protein n=1 Tax=Candida oxycetoniae TaxID=497107 RepID=A0AAI9WXE2_9ASCO|nr:uncharacterized protein KGF56_003488 [Candida oxycetoniae]KAI3403670.1 hypothetical protein KGF56_003488 [Candida oxycetoniae]
MAPQITFVQLTDYLAVPLKLFVKPDLLPSNTSTTTINDKSPISLHNITFHKLQSREIQSLISIVSPQIRQVLYFDPLPTKLTEFRIEKLRVEVPMEVVFQVRFKMGLIEYDDARKYLSENGMDLVLKKRDFKFKEKKTEVEVLIESESSNDGDGDDTIEFTLNENGEAKSRIDKRPKRTKATAKKDNEKDKKIKERYSFSGRRIVGDIATCIRVFVQE